MSSQKQQKTKPKPVARETGTKETVTRDYSKPGIIAVLFVTFICFYPILSGDFVNWDDPNYVLGNTLIMELSFDNIKTIFSTFLMGNYHPLPILTYAIEYSFVQLSPYLFHLDNVLLHLVNTFLVFLFVKELPPRNTIVALVTAFLFGIHPMHVESVAWISERKDVLYVLFLLCSLICYSRYLQKNFSSKYYIYTLVFFILSLLSKAQAVVLAPLLVVMDIYFSRKWNGRLILEKVPFFGLSLAFGIIAIVAQRSEGAVNQVDIEPYKSLFIGNYGLLYYLFSAIAPIKLSALHAYPAEIKESLPMLYYMAPVLVLGIIWLVYKKGKSNKQLVFGLAFFIISILPVLQFLPVGEAVVAERYSYFPYVGLFLGLSYLVYHLTTHPGCQKYRSGVITVVVALLGIFVMSSYNRTQVWKDSFALWTDCIEKYPNSATAYNNRGYMYNQVGQFEKGLEDCNKGLSLDSTYPRLYLNRGVSYDRLKQHPKALADYTTCVRLDSTQHNAYMNRGIIYTDQIPNFDLAIKDFKTVLKLQSDSEDGKLNLAVAYFKSNQFDKALPVLDNGIKQNPSNYRMYWIRSMVYKGLNNYSKALENAQIAKANGITIDGATYQELELGAATEKNKTVVQ